MGIGTTKSVLAAANDQLILLQMLTVNNNTLYGCAKYDLVVAAGVTYAGSIEVDHNILYGSQGYGIWWETVAPRISGCNDLFANALGDVLGGTVSNSDIEVDPQFCDVSVGDVHLRVDSPLLDYAGCGQIGALNGVCTDTVTTVTL